ncbi:hypothetical protein ABTZ98_02185 [Streptomyces bacillaris]
MTGNPAVPVEHFLLLATDFTRHNDASARFGLTGPSPAPARPTAWSRVRRRRSTTR